MSVQLLNKVRTPWGGPGEDFEVETLDNILAYHIQKGHLEIVADGEDLTPKQRLQAQAGALGLSTGGSEAQLQARIDSHLAENAVQDPSAPPEG
jgi:hypothetical protein